MSAVISAAVFSYSEGKISHIYPSLRNLAVQ